jgi:hypothetical protein
MTFGSEMRRGIHTYIFPRDWTRINMICGYFRTWFIPAPRPRMYTDPHDSLSGDNQKCDERSEESLINQKKS